MSHLFISAAHKSSGKTTVSIGLCAALRARGRIVQPYKKGPDYIDPMWLGTASGRPCHNLDFYTMGREEIRGHFARFMQGAEIGLIEGNKGLYDGLDLDGSNSNAALAKLLGAPVVLVLDARGMTRGIAPLILGYQQFDPDIRIAGVILNKLGGSRHEGKLRSVIEHYTDAEVIGAVYQNPDLEIVERHLGLMPSNEAGRAAEHVARIGQLIGEQVDLDRLEAIATSAEPVSVPVDDRSTALPPADVRIGIAQDPAFGFYYPDDLIALRAAGAELVPVNTLTDAALPAIDGLFIGGGFPETHMAALEANGALRSEIRSAIAAGLPVYAECGGLMYLANSITWNGQRCAMVGAIPGDVQMHAKPRGRGYIRLQETADSPWPKQPDAGEGQVFNAHEFHYSSLENLPEGLRYAYKVLRGSGIDGQHDGIVLGNVLAGYAHFRDVAGNRWAERFVRHVRACKNHPTTTKAVNQS